MKSNEYSRLSELHTTSSLCTEDQFYTNCDQIRCHGMAFSMISWCGTISLAQCNAWITWCTVSSHINSHCLSLLQCILHSAHLHFPFFNLAFWCEIPYLRTLTGTAFDRNTLHYGRGKSCVKLSNFSMFSYQTAFTSARIYKQMKCRVFKTELFCEKEKNRARPKIFICYNTYTYTYIQS